MTETENPQDAQFHTLANLMPSLCWMADAEGAAYWFNSRWYEYTCTTLEQMRGWGWQSVHDPAVLAEVLDRWKLSADSGKPFEMTCPIRSKDGVFRNFLTRAVPVHGADGAVSRWLGVSTDVGEAHSTKHLREQFIAILGHDLRNPLQAICATAELLERRLGYPAHTELVMRIKTHARRMSALIDDVLDFSKERLGGGISVDLHVFDNINSGLTSVVQELQEAQPDCQILSNISVTRSVRCDLGRLQQVTSNLLANALTHGRPLSPVKISASADDNDLVLEVWNAGEPIPTESLPKIFEPFWRHSTSRSRNGLGLGLHICSAIVRAHKGQLSVTSTLEGGTQFTARLPLGGTAIDAAAVSRSTSHAVHG